MKNNTAMEELIEKLTVLANEYTEFIKEADNADEPSIHMRAFRNGILKSKEQAEQLLEKEKRIIVEAYWKGQTDYFGEIVFGNEEDAEQYFTYTFKKD